MPTVAHTVLILTDESDRTADRVAAELTLRGVPVVRVDPSAFPSRVSMAATITAGRQWSGALTTIDGDRIEFPEVGSYTCGGRRSS